MRELRLALARWSELLGRDRVDTAPEALARAERGTFETPRRVVAILRPATRDEVRDCLRVAAEAGVAVYPVSCGRNWGLGSAVPVEPGSALLDLSGLDRILDFDAELGTLTVEPGVTFRQAYDFLRAERSRFFLSTTGASPMASLIGNALERGDGAGPCSDRFASAADLEVILSTGELLRGGFGRYGADALAGLHRYGVGPSLEGLFAQSNFGVVTRATFHLARLPCSLTVAHFRVSETEQLPGLLGALRELRMDGTLRAPTGLWNDWRLLSAEMRARDAGTPRTRVEIDEWARRRFGGGRWFGSTAIYAGSDAQGRASSEHLRAVLGPVVDVLHLDRRTGEPSVGDELFSGGDPAARFFQGIPHEESVRSVYWRKRSCPAEELDPDRDACGVHWLCAAVPLRGHEIASAVSLTERAFAARRLDPLCVLVLQSERVAHLIPMVVFDRDEPGADENARALHDELLAQYIASGWLPYRLGIQSMGALPAAVDDSAEVVARLKRALDPAGVLAPGRYAVPGKTHLK